MKLPPQEAAAVGVRVLPSCSEMDQGLGLRLRVLGFGGFRARGLGLGCLGLRGV